MHIDLPALLKARDAAVAALDAARRDYIAHRGTREAMLAAFNAYGTANVAVTEAFRKAAAGSHA